MEVPDYDYHHIDMSSQLNEVVCTKGKSGQSKLTKEENEDEDTKKLSDLDNNYKKDVEIPKTTMILNNH